MENRRICYGQLWSAIIALVVGVLFVIFPESVVRLMVKIVGIVSLVAGVSQIISYLAYRKSYPQTIFPIFGILIAVWGILLLVQPEVWVNLFMIVMSVPIILLAIWQLVVLNGQRQMGFRLGWGSYVFPVLSIAAGIVVVFNPFSSAMWLVLFVGVWSILYGIVGMVDFFRFSSAR